MRATSRTLSRRIRKSLERAATVPRKAERLPRAAARRRTRAQPRVTRAWGWRLSGPSRSLLATDEVTQFLAVRINSASHGEHGPCEEHDDSITVAKQFVEIGGRRYSHIVDPRTGQALTDRSSVTVIAPDGMTADGLASALSVLGPKQGLALADATPGAAALIVRAVDGKLETHESSRFKDIARGP